MSTILFMLPFLVGYAVLVIYSERKISAFAQDRLGPMEIGYYGLLQTVADLIKLIQKEDIVPAAADRKLFKLAPIVIFVIVFVAFAWIPLAPDWSGSPMRSGVFFLLAVVSLDVIGILAAGWSSHNKYSTFGTLRSAAQMVSYEVPLGLSIVIACMACGTLDLQEISYQQGILVHQLPATAIQENFLFGIYGWDIKTTNVGGVLTWNVFRCPPLLLVWVIFFIASLAECNRAPFDLPEAESELVAGYRTEYAGFRWAIIMLAEYSMMLLVAFIGVILFWGSWNTPFPNVGNVSLASTTTGPVWGIFWLVSKTLAMVALQIWIRWTYPRLRVDQLMAVGWKYLTPAALGLLLLVGFWKIYFS